MANWRIGFLKWQGNADNVNKALTTTTAPEKTTPEQTASKKPAPSTTAIP